MNTFHTQAFCCLIAYTTIGFADNHVSSLPKLYIDLYNKILDNESAIQTINTIRPSLFIYTDFGGGKQGDLQTRGELASTAWKATLQKTVWIHDAAMPLSPTQAACTLAATFPYVSKQVTLPITNQTIHTIVMHVVDPGVGNSENEPHEHPRTLALRKDGILFIGPDNGSLSFVCPPGSLAGIWEINSALISKLSTIDIQAGGTFHGRDIFCEAACRIAAGTHSCNDLGIHYPSLCIKNRLEQSIFNKFKDKDNNILFEQITTSRFELTLNNQKEYNLFNQAFLLGIVQSPLDSHNNAPLITKAKKLFIVHFQNHTNSLIAIVNHKTGNIFLGPDNGLGTSFFKYYVSGDYQVFRLTKKIFARLCATENNESAYKTILAQPLCTKRPTELNFLGDESALTRNKQGWPKALRSRIWIDAYGNIKTTAQTIILDEAKQHHAMVLVELNGIKKHLIFAKTFSQVPAKTLFIYNGSSAVMGPNPRRSNRYVEISTNGVFGTFAINCFSHNHTKPQSGQEIVISFLYDGIDQHKSRT